MSLKDEEHYHFVKLFCMDLQPGTEANKKNN